MSHGKQWSESKKVQVVSSYLVLGKAPMVEAVTGVPAQTIRIWKMQPWWKDLVKEIQSSEDQELDGKLSGVIDRSIDVINDRLQNGDFILDSRTGSIKRVPVKLRDSHRVVSDLIDKRNVLRGKPTSITEKISTEDILKKLALQFQEFTKFQNTRLIEHAVHEEREEGLRDGEQEVQLTPPHEETPGRTEQSPPTGGKEVGTEYNGGCRPYQTPEQRGCSEQALELESSLPPTESFISAK